MGNGVFTLELDTTPPDLRVFSPSYCTRKTKTRITISSDDILGNNQEIYSIDGNGVRRNYIFIKQDDYTYESEVTFTEYPLGVARFYARLDDEVLNESSLYEFRINIIEAGLGEISTSVFISKKDMMAVTNKKEMHCQQSRVEVICK